MLTPPVTFEQHTVYCTVFFRPDRRQVQIRLNCATDSRDGWHPECGAATQFARYVPALAVHNSETAYPPNHTEYCSLHIFYCSINFGGANIGPTAHKVPSANCPALSSQNTQHYLPLWQSLCSCSTSETPSKRDRATSGAPCRAGLQLPTSLVNTPSSRLA